MRLICLFVLIFSSPNKFSETIITTGIVNTQSKLIIAVRDIERATSPFAKEVNILEVTPPGAAAIIINPMESYKEIGNNLIIIKAIRGNKIIWPTNPTKKSFGCFNILKKSAPVSPKPRANIINANASGKKISVTIPII